MSDIEMTIGQLAKKAGINLQTIRYYENLKLIPEPGRSDSGYRKYGEDYLEHIKFVKNAQDLGFTLEEIQKLVELKTNPSAMGNDVKEVLDRKIIEVNEKIDKFNNLKKYLEHLNGSCSGDMATSSCPIIQSLSDQEKQNKKCH